MFLEAEQAHRLAVLICKWKLLPSVTYKDPEVLVRNEKKDCEKVAQK